MDPSLSRSLHDRLYEKRKTAALELERIVRNAKTDQDLDKVETIITELCQDLEFGPTRSSASALGGLIGLAAVSIALGQNVAGYLPRICPPVLGCLAHPEVRTRYYACEAMYNIAKVAKGEILPFFNDVFDALCRLAADTELSVKNGSELLDRLIKDIVTEKAAHYVSLLNSSGGQMNEDEDESGNENDFISLRQPVSDPAFSLQKFVPLLADRIYVLNSFTRMFLISWITLLDSVPDLELVVYLPEFLDGLINFISDNNRDVQVAAENALEGFLTEIRRITIVKKALKATQEKILITYNDQIAENHKESPHSDRGLENLLADVNDEEWVPGQDVIIDHPRILTILMSHLANSEQATQILSLRWMRQYFEIAPEELIKFTPELLKNVLPILANESAELANEARQVNSDLSDIIISTGRSQTIATETNSQASSQMEKDDAKYISKHTDPFDYEAAVEALTSQFDATHEENRKSAFDWLIMLHGQAKRQVIRIDDLTFIRLLETLSDPSESVVERDIQLLAQICADNDGDYFIAFFARLLALLDKDRKLLESRGSLIIRQFCAKLSAERIYRCLAERLECYDDLEFAAIMVQLLQTNLNIAPEMICMRRQLKKLESKDGQSLFVSLYRSWCHSAVAVFSLCLLSQAYQQAAALLSIMGEFEITVDFLIQIDKLVQLLESPVFTYLRLQLLEPEKYPYLYKCLYGLLMLLPQSTAFATLRNRLNSVSSLNILHTTYSKSPSSTSELQQRLMKSSRGKSTEDIKWQELLDFFQAIRLRHQTDAKTHSQLGFSISDSLGSSSTTAAAMPSSSGKYDQKASTIATRLTPKQESRGRSINSLAAIMSSSNVKNEARKSTSKKP